MIIDSGAAVSLAPTERMIPGSIKKVPNLNVSGFEGGKGIKLNRCGTLGIKMTDKDTGHKMKYLLDNVYVCDKLHQPLISTSQLSRCGADIYIGPHGSSSTFPSGHCSNLNTSHGGIMFLKEERTTPERVTQEKDLPCERINITKPASEHN